MNGCMEELVDERMCWFVGRKVMRKGKDEWMKE